MTDDLDLLAFVDSMPLTHGQKRVLQRLADEEDAELVWACPGGWLIDTDKIDGRKECGTCHEGDETSEVRIGYETIGAREVLAGTNETTLFEGCRDCAERFAMTLRLVLPR